MARAAILTAANQPLVIDEIEVEAPRAAELKVKMLASGVCHSDLHLITGDMEFPLPMVLGHEAVAEVTELGEGVSGFKPGDRVVLSAIPQCGECFFCKKGQPTLCVQSFRIAEGGMPDGTTRLLWNDAPLHSFCSLATFAEEAVVPAISAVPVSSEIPPPQAALVGCAVATGLGAVRRIADVPAGDSVAVVGCGGVGLNIIQGAKLAGAERIFAIDRVAAKEDLARTFGATDFVDASAVDPVAVVQEAMGGLGVDISFEAIGVTDAELQMVEMTRPGGQAVFVGTPAFGVDFSIPATAGFIGTGKTLSGCVYGSVHIHEDFPAFCGSYQDGELLLDELISKTIDLGDINDAFDDMKAGAVARSVIVYS